MNRQNQQAERILVIDGHPDPDPGRFTHAIADAYVEGARSANRKIDVVAIANMDFYPVRTASHFSMPSPYRHVRDVQSQLVSAGHIVLIYPLWLGSMPALLRAFLEQLASGGVATRNDGHGWSRRLSGKSGRLIVSMDSPTIAERWFVDAFGIGVVEHPVLHFLGVSPVRATLFGRAGDTRSRERRLRLVRNLGARAA